MNFYPSGGGVEPTKKYLQLLHALYKARKVGDGFATTAYLAQATDSNQSNMHHNLDDFARRKIIRKRKEGHNCIWRITPSGVRYLYSKEVITDKGEMEQAVAELERSELIVGD